MSVDIATLGLEIRSDGVVVASDRLRKLTQDGSAAENATTKLSSSFDNLTGYVKSAAAALGLYKLAEMTKDAALLSARYETLAVVMQTVGNNAGYTGKQMEGFQAGLEKAGISAVSARQALVRMGEGNIDFAKSSDLARVAQDAAVVAQTNSSDAFERMTTGIATGQAIILHHMGLMTNFEGAYARLASTLGKSASELTEHEKVQARVNETIRAGSGIAGTYEAAMGTVGKQIYSMDRYMQNLKVSFGEAFQPALMELVQTFTESLIGANKSLKENPEIMAEWKNTILQSVYAVEAEFIRLGMLLDKLGGTKSQIDLLGSSVGNSLGLSKQQDPWLSMMLGSKEEFEAAANANLDYEKRYYEKEAMLNKLAEKSVSVDANTFLQASVAKSKQQELDSIATSKMQAAVKEEQDRQLQYKKTAEHAEKLLALQKTHADATLALQTATSSIQMDSLKASFDQGLVSTSDYLAQKYNLEKAAVDRSIATAQAEMDGQKAIYDQMKGNSYADKDTLAAYEAKYAKAKEAFDLASISRSKLENDTIIERIKLMGEEAERAKIKNLMQDQFGMLQQQIDLAIKAGYSEEAFEQQKILDINKLKFDYSQKMLDYQKQLNVATGEEATLIQQNMDLYNSLTAASLNAIEARTNAITTATQQTSGNGTSWGWDSNGNIIGGGSSTGHMGDTTGTYTITNPAQTKTNTNTSGATAAANAAIAAYNTALKAAATLADDLSIRTLNLKGLNDEAAVQKLVISQRKELTQAQTDGIATGDLILVQQAEYNKLLHDQSLAKATKDTETFFTTIKTALADMISTGNSLVTSLRAAATSLSAAKNGLLTSNQSNLSPAAIYAQTRSDLASTVQQAMATGDANLYSKIPALVTAFLDKSQSANASSAAYSADFKWAQDLLSTSSTAADLAANNATTVNNAAAAQQATLDAIKAALTTDNTAALPKLYLEMSSNTGKLKTAVDASTAALGSAGAIATGLTGVNGVTDALSGSGSNSVKTWLAAVNTTTGTVTTSTNSIKTATDNVSSYTNATYTSLTNGAATGYLTGKVTTGKINTEKTVYYYSPSNPSQIGSVINTYTYYKRGGIANDPSGRSIFGESGPEAAVPLPDGRSIPVTLSGYSDQGTVEALQEAIAELKAQTRVLQAGLSELIGSSKRQEKNSQTVANSARLAVNQ